MSYVPFSSLSICNACMEDDEISRLMHLHSFFSFITQAPQVPWKTSAIQERLNVDASLKS